MTQRNLAKMETTGSPQNQYLTLRKTAGRARPPKRGQSSAID
jgi:hypothetical protein